MDRRDRTIVTMTTIPILKIGESCYTAPIKPVVVVFGGGNFAEFDTVHAAKSHLATERNKGTFGYRLAKLFYLLKDDWVQV